MKEEAWLEIMRMDDKSKYFVTAPDKNFRMALVFYEIKLKNLDFTLSEECQEIKFFTREEAEKTTTDPILSEFLKQFISW